MIKADQAKFYYNLGSVLKRQRLAMNLTIAQLCKLSEEQNKTIRSIESGRPCSMHHLVWMEEILGLKIQDVYNYQGEESNDNTLTISDLI